MKLLLVDDDIHVMDGIKQRVNTELCGITRIFTASCVEEAKTVLEQYSVDILISDIEMPHETGLDLLLWIREKYPDVKVIMLTSYANFNYAQRAISLDCMEYLLKPVDYEKLEQVLNKAVQKVREEQKRQLKDHWAKRPQYYFWLRMTAGNIPLQPEEIRRETKMYCLPYDDRVYFAVYMIDLKNVEKAEGREEICHSLYSAYNVWGEGSGAALEAVVPVGANMAAAVLSRQEGEARPLPQIGGQLLKYCCQAFGLECNCGLGDWCKQDDFYEQVRELQEILWENQSVSQKVFCQWDIKYEEILYCTPEVENWEALLYDGAVDNLKERIHLYLKRQSIGSRMGRKQLKQFRLDLTQMIYTYLSKSGIQAHQVFHNERNDKLHRNAINSIDAMQQYAEYLLDQSRAFRALSAEPEGAIKQVANYINSHYNEELSRDDLASMVYLNPDYLSRKFKEEKGISISSYIMVQRVEKAKELLRTTSFPINVVAMEVGYDNFAYFTKVFRNKTGLSPNEYRKNLREGSERNRSK